MASSTVESQPTGKATFEDLGDGVEINRAGWTEQAQRILTPEVQRLLAGLHRELQATRRALLDDRRRRQERWDAGEVPGHLPEEELPQAHGDWRVRALPADLLRRRVEITGPIHDPKMVINMLSRGDDGERADAAMLDFEDSMKPSWANVLQGVENLTGAADGSLTFVKPGRGGEPEKRYELDPDDMPLVMVRCRGLHLDESNLLVDGEPISGGLFDLALSTWHSAEKLLARDRTPKYYVPKVEHHLEARWWNRLLTRLEEEIGVDVGTFRATFLIETLPAAFQMEEILWELRDHAAGLNVGRWDKIFSDIKVLKTHPDRIMADRASISLNRPWMRNYAELLISICHRHGAFAMGGMAAFTPGRTPERREEQTRKVVEDKELEHSLGHDGCWVSHPYFIGPAMSAFPEDHQLAVRPEIDQRPDLLPQGSEPRTLEGLSKNVRVGIGYMHGWLQDIGCVAWDDLMEDLATLEISRAQTWQWIHHGVELDDGTRVDRATVERIFDRELEQIAREVRDALGGADDDAIEAAIDLFERARDEACAIFTEEEFRPFLAMRSDLVGAHRGP